MWLVSSLNCLFFKVKKQCGTCNYYDLGHSQHSYEKLMSFSFNLESESPLYPKDITTVTDIYCMFAEGWYEPESW